jgi:hypothetical protein
MMVTSFQIQVLGSEVGKFSVKNEYHQDQFIDIKGSEWYVHNVQKCYELGLMMGKKESFFDVNGKVTLAEAVATAARAHEIYMGGDGVIESSGTNWYDGVVAYAISNEIIKQGDFSNYRLNATRGQVAYIFANVLPKSEFIELNYIENLPDVYFNVPYCLSIVFLYRAGVLTGSDKFGTFNGDSYITRAEAAALIIRVVSPEDRITFAPEAYIFQGNVPNNDPYTQFRYFTNANNGTAPILNFEDIKIRSIKNPYDNGSNNSTELITKSEGIKVILSMVLGTTDISKLAEKPVSTYKNAIWVEYAQSQGIINVGTITAVNEGTPITLEESINCLILTMKKFAPEVDFSSLYKVMLADSNDYNKETRFNAYFAYLYDLLGNSASFESINLRAQMTKGKMDDLLTRTINQFNLVMAKKGQIKTIDLPKNVQAYPYIVSGIDNSVYEMPFSGWNSGEAGPRLCYQNAKGIYGRMDQMITEAYTEFVNIDYETISEDDFKRAKEWSLDYSCGWVDELDQRIEGYVDYVKKNKIKVTGKVTPLLPIVYLDGYHYRVRTKIEYTIVSSDTNIDLLLGDRIADSGSSKLGYSPTVYVSQSKTIYVDIALESAIEVSDSKPIGKIFYLGKYFPLSKQIAGQFAVKTVKM